MTREEWRQRMLDAGIAEDVVDATLEGMDDSDFARMKDMDSAQIRAELIKAELLKDDGDDDDAEDDTEDPDVDEDVVDLTEAFQGLKDDLIAKLDAAMSEREVEVVIPELKDLPGIQEQLKSLAEGLAKVQELLTTLAKSEEERLMALAKDLSSSSRSRLVIRQKDDVDPAEVERLAAAIQQQLANAGVSNEQMPQFTPVVRDASGNQYQSFGEMMTAQ